MYGKELILDMHDCNVFDEKNIRLYFRELCELIDMEACDVHFWIGEDDDPKISGTSAIQFIVTSNITIHALPRLKKVFINIFSCKDFSTTDAMTFTMNFFNGTIVQAKVVDRI